jgi:hypothetical protein
MKIGSEIDDDYRVTALTVNYGVAVNLDKEMPYLMFDYSGEIVGYMEWFRKRKDAMQKFVKIALHL